MLGGVATTVESDRIGNAFGASNLEVDTQPPTADDPSGCSGNVVADNLVEGYATAHGGTVPGETANDHPEADGFGVYCGSTDVRGNTIIDVSDAAIVLFNGSPTDAPAPPQLSVVADNTIISAGNSLYWGIVTDPFWSLHVAPVPGGDPPGTITRAFAFGPVHSATIIDNRLWSGTRTHFDVILSSGTHELFGSTVHQNCLFRRRRASDLWRRQERRRGRMDGELERPGSPPGRRWASTWVGPRTPSSRETASRTWVM